MKKLFSACIATVVLAGCASAPPRPEPYYAAPIVDATEENRSHYWVTTREHFFVKPKILPSRTQPCSYVKLHFTIDSNGNTFDPEIVETWPNDRFVGDALALVERHKFKPTDDNAERVPVRTQMVTSFMLGGRDCDDVRPEFASVPLDEET